jgi:hypothetical protein
MLHKIRSSILILCAGCFVLVSHSSSADDWLNSWKAHARNWPAPVAQSGGRTIYAFGGVYIYDVSPDFAPDLVIQDGNRNERVKIRPRRSWELKENHIGSMVSWQPRTPENDFQPYLPINLIDGNYDTNWCSREQARPDVEPAWIRLDLPRETRVKNIRLVPRKEKELLLRPGKPPWKFTYGSGVPLQLEIKMSRDAWHWETVYKSGSVEVPPAGKALEFPLNTAAPTKQIWIIGNEFTRGDHDFSLAEVEVLDERGDNVALASRGTGVTVSSTNYGLGSSKEVYDQMWPVQYDLGVTWMRLSGSNPPYYHDTLSWRMVEREKGKYVIDERTDEAITEAARNGVQISTILGYGNWLYAPEAYHDPLDPAQFPQPMPPGALNREAREGYKNWARFMARHFKGRIRSYEIWNEPGEFGWGTVKDWMKSYYDLVKDVAPVIRAEDPDAKVLVTGIASPGYPNLERVKRPDGWFRGLLTYGVVPYLDAFAWQTQNYLWFPEQQIYKDYARGAREFEQDMKQAGFKGIYLVRENWWGAPYPMPYGQAERKFPNLDVTMTEIRKAKDMARMFVMSAGVGATTSFWCNTWFDQDPLDEGLFRNTFSADPMSPMQPQTAYYVMRTLATVMDRTKATDTLKVEFSNTPADFSQFSFTLPGNQYFVTAWVGGISADDYPGIRSDLLIRGSQAHKVTGIDILNGVSQDLRFTADSAGTHLTGVLLRDYPLFIQIGM